MTERYLELLEEYNRWSDRCPGTASGAHDVAQIMLSVLDECPAKDRAKCLTVLLAKTATRWLTGGIDHD